MGSSKFRTPCSFLNLLLSCLNFILFILSSASLAPTILLRMPPTSLGWAFLMISCISLFSSFVGFYSQLTHFCFITHVSLLLSSSIGQLLGILALFTRENSSLSMLKSPRDMKEAKLLVSCWVREYEGLEAEREAAARKRSRRIARVQEESMANAAKIAEVKAKEFDEKMKNKYGQWVKTDFEG
ncbi:uncharacterized protein LOC100256155 [Vitis vinifera]|uniref:Uncharacterized protein n=1 Tax=Vitis vinifera TaxID=29760 RepID=A0A438J8T6_VITVI|nr:uncharacterized protein LOC100256155 [Vitis vinifera]RVX05375.1 hypothetical protein CK203_013520 [Vitis vinifera]